ncbi:ATP-binding protein [Oleiphilus sp. HI0080]|uniref:ATP-binding protein n=1 Tax=Oleiphilus sp. HI0080 TaxID=1822255 RepID=UPI000AE28B9A|nr:ATP-binding protein [Oleiphilus sp. HI0080]
MAANRAVILIIIWSLISLLATGVILYYDAKSNTSDNQLNVGRELARSRSVIEQSVNRYFTLLKALEAFVHANKDLYANNVDAEFSDRFDRFATSLEQNNNSIISLQLAPNGVVTYVSQKAKNLKAVGHDLLKDDHRRDQVIQTIINKATVVAGPLTLLQGGNAIIARKAIFTDPGVYRSQSMFDLNRALPNAAWPAKIPGDFWGFATMLIDTERLFKEFELDKLPKEYGFALKGRHGLGEEGEVFWGDHSIFDAPEDTTEIMLPGGSWVMGVKHVAPSNYMSLLLITLTGLVVSGFGAYVIHSRYKKLEAESDAKTHSRFLATMSHEIRTPMNGIIGVAEVLGRSDLSDSQQRQLDKILDSSKILLRLVNDVLDFSKIDAGNLKLEQNVFDPRKTIESVLHSFDLQANEKNVSINLNIASDFPDCFQGDEVRIKQVLVNILSNAIKFTERGTITISAELKDYLGDQYLSFRVKDTGIGMSEQELKRIFNPFTQADQSITRKYGGTGLGLVICEKIVHLMGGNISVKSKQGKGSSFRILIPYQEVTAEALEVVPDQSLEHAPEVRDRQDLKLLVVDDQLINLEVAAMILNELGYECQRATSGRQALEMIEQERFDIVYMDRQMPEMDGLEATRKIRAFTQSDTAPWVVALTASAREEEKEEYLAAGANAFLSKPVDMQSFSSSIESFLKFTSSS